jgi:energy-coupling factor transporter ATP-binding protein EcfA2
MARLLGNPEHAQALLCGAERQPVRPAASGDSAALESADSSSDSDPDPDPVVETITLAPEQQAVLDWAVGEQRQNVIVLVGPPGSGKTTVVHRLTAETRERGVYTLVCAKQHVVCDLHPDAWTAVLAELLGTDEESSAAQLAATAHRRLLDASWGGRPAPQLLRLARRARAHRLLLVVDEVFTLTARELDALDQLLRRIVGGDARQVTTVPPFGGVPVVLLGDPDQLRPFQGAGIELSALLSNEASLRAHVCLHELAVQHRAAACERLQLVLDELRHGRCLTQVQQLLRGRVATELDVAAVPGRPCVPPDAIVVCATNDDVVTRNAQRIRHEQTGPRPTRVVCFEGRTEWPGGRRGTYTDAQKARIRARHRLDEAVTVGVGWPMTVTSNQLRRGNRRVHNRTSVTVREIDVERQRVLVELDDASGGRFWIGAVKTEPARGVVHWQIPLRLAWARTTDTVQGCEFQRRGIATDPATQLKPGALYVCLSRVRRWDQVYLLGEPRLNRYGTALETRQTLRDQHAREGWKRLRRTANRLPKKA